MVRPGIARKARGLAAALCVFAVAHQALAQPLRPAAAVALDEMSFAAGGEVSATLTTNGLVGFLRTAPGAVIPVDHLGGAEARARELLETYGGAFGLVPGVEMQVLAESAPDEVGMEHVRFRQT
jgi:hypothetical protein